MKKLIDKNAFIIFLLVQLICYCNNKIYAYSDEFNLMIEAMDIEITNVNGLKLNEEVYNEYQLFVYGSPLIAYKGQRWKNVEDGHWSMGSGAWNGSGIRGEYWILGENYNGKEVHNHLFPVDIEPPTSPTQWRYAVISDALESWQDASKYMDDTQREYMLTQKLARNNITYDLTVPDIGLDKVRIENYATWKSKGTVYTQRYDMNNKKWAANFLIPPMAGDASLEGYAIFSNGMEYVIGEEKNNIDIPITYGCKVENLTDYAKKEHVKSIKSELIINGKSVDYIEASETTAVEDSTEYKVTNEMFENSSVLVLNVQVKSTLFTKFTTDGAMVDVKQYMLYVYKDGVEPEVIITGDNHVSDDNYANYPKLPPPKITSVEIMQMVGGSEEELWISRKTGKAFICAGQTITLQVKAINSPEKVTIEFDGDTSITTLDSLTKQFEWTEPRNRGKKTIVSSYSKLQEMYKGKIKMKYERTVGEEKVYTYTYVIPYGTKQTLHSWSTLREISNNAFDINENKLFTRIRNPYEIVLKASGPTGINTKRIELDVFERWDTLYNRDISRYTKKSE